MTKTNSWHLNAYNLYFFILFLACLWIHLALSFVGWKNTICDFHGFRQTQTAITSYYIINDGFKINYITPVLGKPWSIPMEFPLFQWIVAAVVMITKIPLDQGGRLVTLSFFYLSLIPIYFLLRLFIAKKAHVFAVLCLVLISPFYIFWSRTFMIESLALFLSLVFLAAIVKVAINPGLLISLFTCAIGSLAGLTKLTTNAIFILPAIFLFILFSIRKNRQEHFSSKALKKQVIYGCLVFVVPLVINTCWVIFSDRQKSFNPIASCLTSGQLLRWNFGTIKEKLSYATWRIILSHIRHIYWDFFWVNFLFVFSFILNRKYWKEILACLIFFLFGPLLFTNLYYVHEYYFYANAVFLLVSFGFLAVSFLESKNLLILSKIAIIPVILLAMYKAYFSHYYSIQKTNNLTLQPLSEAVKYSTKKEGVILIYGFDWSSELPYYSQRRALMIPNWLPYKDSKVQLALKALNSGEITAVIVSADSIKDKEVTQELMERFKLLPRPVFEDTQGSLYLVESYTHKY